MLGKRTGIVLIGSLSLGPGWLSAATPILDYTASLDASPVNGIWEDVINGDNNYGLSGGTTYNGSPLGAPSGVTAVYNFTGSNSGASGFNIEGITGGNPTGGSASFEILFKASDNFGKELLWEAGNTTGSSLTLNGNELQFVSRNSSTQSITALDPGGVTSLRGGWVHAVGVIDTIGNQMSLYVNGTLAGSPIAYLPNDWSGGDNSNLGSINGGIGGSGGVDFSGFTSFTGEMAAFRLYDSALDQTDVNGLFATVGTFPSGSGPVNLLSTTFNARNVNGNTAENVQWVTNGVDDPGDLTAVEVDTNATVNLAGLFDGSSTRDMFAPNLNLGNEDDWYIDIALNPSGDDIEVLAVELDWTVLDNGGNPSDGSRSLDWIATITGSSSGVVATKTLTPGSSANLATITFDSPVLLDDSESWTLQIYADGFSGSGFNAGFDGLNVVGNILTSNAIIPEFGSTVLLGIGMIGLALRRRR